MQDGRPSLKLLFITIHDAIRRPAIAARPLTGVRQYQTAPCTQRSTNQNRPHCTATYLGQLSLHLPHKVAPALFGPLTLALALSNPPAQPRGQPESRPEPTTILLISLIK